MRRAMKRIIGGAIILLVCGGVSGVPAWGEDAAGESKPVGEPESVEKLIADCKASYEKVKDYRCTFQKQERMEDVLKPIEVMEMTFLKPQAIHLVWKNGILKNREVLYVAGKNEGKLLVYTGNLPAFRKVFRISLDSVEASRETRHPITEAGIGFLCVRLGEQFEKGKTEGKLEVRYVGVREVEGRKTWHLVKDLEDGGRREWDVDVELVLPTRVETYDKEGKLLESYGYSKIKLNPGLKDEDFDPEKIFF